MEYSKLEYFLFKISEILNGRFFVLIVGLVIVIGATLFFVYDYKTDGPVLSTYTDDNLNKIKHAKKNSKKTEVMLVIAPLVVIVLLFVAKSSLSKIPSPEMIVPNVSQENVIKGKVIWIDNTDGRIGITTKKRKRNNPIVASVNNTPVNPGTPLIYSYAGTNLDNKQFVNLSIGNHVEIHVHPYKWAYKNHGEYGNDKHASEVIDLLNISKVNGNVVKAN